MPRVLRGFSALTLGALLCAPVARAQHHHPEGKEVIGRVVFPVSCNTEAAGHFERRLPCAFVWFEAAEAETARAASRLHGAWCALGRRMTSSQSPDARPPTGTKMRTRSLRGESERLTEKPSPRQLYATVCSTLSRRTVPHATRMRGTKMP